jgi:integrase/recombinase XerD
MGKNDKALASKINTELAKKFEEASKKKVSISDFITDFIGQFISPQTQKAYIKDLQVFFDFLKTGNVFINHPSQIEGHHFQFYRDHLIELGLSSATINRRLVGIRSFIKWSMSMKLIDYNPLDVVKLPKVQTEKPTLAFDDSEVIEMLNSPDLATKKGQIDKVVMIMLFSLGLRRSELTNIKCKDIYQERKHNVVKIRGKGGKDRHLPLAPFIAQAIKEYVDFMANIDVNLEPDDYLIQNSKKHKILKPIDGSTVYRIIEKYAKICGINKSVSPHSCRATAISHLLDTQKTPIRDVAIFAGHSKITTTERYDKRRESLDNSAAYQVDYSKKDSA